MLSLLPGMALFIYCVYSFCREVRLDRTRFLEQDRLGDEHIMREIDQFLREKEQAKETRQNTGSTETACLSPQNCGDSCD